ncbi:hypothetical protein AB0B45_43690 [Nonomuraea sp. NPDC049152]|uniref:hypothetical protein n=1 Tax=Nonomuraea sp. NPDC049152 TaxID=3154350 RepID=UPI00340CDD93
MTVDLVRAPERPLLESDVAKIMLGAIGDVLLRADYVVLYQREGPDLRLDVVSGPHQTKR